MSVTKSHLLLVGFSNFICKTYVTTLSTVLTKPIISLLVKVPLPLMEF